jgi:molecular chaperone GrpE
VVPEPPIESNSGVAAAQCDEPKPDDIQNPIAAEASTEIDLSAVTAQDVSDLVGSISPDAHSPQVLSSLLDAIDGTREDLQVVRQSLGGISAQNEQILDMQRLAAEQSRRLASKVERAATAAAHAQFRDFLNGLLLFYDLLSGLAANTTAPRAAPPGEGYRMLLRQLDQLMHLNGIERIPVEGIPDYQLHRAVKKVTVAAPEDHNRIIETSRPGFRIGDQVLRPADVVVTVYEAAEAGGPGEKATEPSQRLEIPESDPEEQP